MDSDGEQQDNAFPLGGNGVPLSSSRLERSTGVQLPTEIVASGFRIRQVLDTSTPDITDLLLERADGSSRLLRIFREPDFDTLVSLRDKFVTAGHPNLQGRLDAGFDSDNGWELFEYPSIGTLAQYLAANGGRMPRALLPELLAQLVGAITYIHSTFGVAHKDIRPEWIFIESLEPTFKVTIANFGVAAAYRSQGLHLGPLLDSPYAPPEVALGDSGTKWDWWSLGMIMLEAVSGQHPYRLRGDWVPLKPEDRKRIISVGAVDEEPWKLLCRGLLVTYPEDRWSGSDVMDWLSGVNPVVRASETQGATSPFPFAANLFWTVSDLVSGIEAHWSDAARLIASPSQRRSLKDWLSESGVPAKSFEALSDSYSNHSLNYRVAQLVSELGHGASTSFMGVPISLKGLSELAERALSKSGKDPGKNRSSARARQVVAELLSSQALVLFSPGANQLDYSSLNLRWQSSVREINQLSSAAVPAHLAERIPEKLVTAPAHLLLCEISDSYMQVISTQATDFASRFRAVDWFRHLCDVNSGAGALHSGQVLICLLAEYAQLEDKQGHTPPRIKEFSVSPDAAIEYTPLTVSWDVEGAQTVEIEGIGSVAATGTTTVTAKTSKAFKLVATNINGTNQRHSDFITILAAPKVKPNLPATRLPTAAVELRLDSALLELGKLPTPFAAMPALVPFENAEGYSDAIPQIAVDPITLPQIPNIVNLVPDLRILDERQQSRHE